ncbi:unnamed protein product [Soboliphyme baturini]|uniref:Heterogeneous nuclear ribonucleoprotein A1 n=1 Tax=Soboliphyme baturini TaxID=241478 RepID=A0A183IJU0_9BILA|nr:unnamed protein product [Soboliphyme baturini]
MPIKAEVYQHISYIDRNEQLCKIFIGGITLNTTDDDLKEFYSQWGEITDVVVMRDPSTNRSRGFGFVTYADPEMVNAAMGARPHVIDGKEVEPKRAMPKDVMNRPEAHLSVKKLYVSGIKDDHTEEMLRDYFASFGNILEIEIKLDQVTGKKRGFAFVTFDDYDPVDRIVLERSHMINGKRCDVKKALSKEEMRKMQQQDMDRQHRDSRSRGMMRGGLDSDMMMPYGGGMAWGPSGMGGDYDQDYDDYRGGGWNQGGGSYYNRGGSPWNQGSSKCKLAT